MTHTMVTFRLHRTGVVLIVLGALLLGVLLFTAGCLAGLRFGQQQTAATSHLLDETDASSTSAGDRADATKTISPSDPPSPVAGRL